MAQEGRYVIMEENKMLEKIWSEAQTVEVPKDLSPERMKERIGAQKEEPMRHKSEKQKRGSRFKWHGFGSRVAAAGIVLALSLGAYGVAERQPAYEPPVQEEEGENAAGQEQKAPVEEPLKAADEGKEAEKEEETPVVKRLGSYHLAESYEEVYAMVADVSSTRKEQESAVFTDGDLYEGVVFTDGVLNDGASMPAEDSMSRADADASSAMKAEHEKESAPTSGQPDFSTTNLQVSGVDESDIVKTDGNNIYIVAEDEIRIVDVTTGVPRQLGSIRPQFSGNMDSIREMYVEGDRLILLVQVEDMEADAQCMAGDAAAEGAADMEADETPAGEDGMTLTETNEDAAMKGDYIVDRGWGYGYDRVHTQILTYDITSPAGAKLLGTYEQDGSYSSSRKIGDTVYLFTQYGFLPIMPYGMLRDGSVQAEADEAQFRMPQIQKQTIPEDCIYLPSEGATSGVLISAMDIGSPETALDQKFILNGWGEYYVTGKSIYLYEGAYDAASDRQRTKLTKFKIGGGKITADCAEAVPGMVEDTFAIHESADGYLYVLTTDYRNAGPTNQLYVLNEKLKIHGKIEDIANGETVYAARFVDDIGYFVTYRNTDPLFTVDFSDPKNPKLIGELEIPGFSDYLQFWDDKHLIGVGEERKEKDSEFVGIKVSLYDISDPTDVKESSKVVIEGEYGAPANYNYKALLADRGKNIIAFVTDGQDGNYNYRVTQQVFAVQDGKLVQVAKDRLPDKEGSQRMYGLIAEDFRNLYIGEKLYLVSRKVVFQYDMANDFERTQTLELE